MNVVNEINRNRISIDLTKPTANSDHHNIIGVFGVKSWESANIGYLFKIDPDDPIYLDSKNDIKIKKDQQIFRYESRIMFNQCRPVILINTKLKTPRVYFLTQDSFDGTIDEIVFETKGIPIKFMWIFEDSKHLFD